MCGSKKHSKSDRAVEGVIRLVPVRKAKGKGNWNRNADDGATKD